MTSMENAMSKGKPAQSPRADSREAEVRQLGREAAALSLVALRLSRMAAELARPAQGGEAA
jgi:hypothetical protein